MARSTLLIVFGEALFKESPIHQNIWEEYPPHPLQEQEPNGDRQWIEKFQILQKLTEFEDSIGLQFTHIRLLARAFTDRSIGFTNLTLGSNQRLEFLGDTVLQLIASDYLYKYFPEHHEGHLSLLRSSLVNNRTQAVVCDDLGIGAYAIHATTKAELKIKDRADLLESFLGALYVDKGLRHCEVFCNVCFFPRLHDFIIHQDWNDPKSKLQQCCLTLRTMEGGVPEIPIYKVIECMGPSNTRLYTVAVYFKGKRLAQATGHSIQQAEMNAANEALNNSQNLFPQLDHQKRVIAKSIKQDPLGGKDDNKRGQNDVGDRNRKIERIQSHARGSASVGGSKNRDSSASETSRLQPNKESRTTDQEPTKAPDNPSTLQRGIQNWSPENRLSLTRNPSQQRSLSPTFEPSRTKSLSPIRKSEQLRSPSVSGSRFPSAPQSRSLSPLNKESKRRSSSPYTGTFHTKQPSPCRSPMPCRQNSSSPIREQSKVSSVFPPRSRSSSLLRERSQLRKSSHIPRSSSPRRLKHSSLRKEQTKLRSPSPLEPRSPSLLRKKIKPIHPRIQSPGRQGSLSPARNSSWMKSLGPIPQCDYQSSSRNPKISQEKSSSRNTKISPKKSSKSRHKTTYSAKTYPNERLSHCRTPDRATRPKMASPTKETPGISKSPRKPKRPSEPDGLGTKLHSHRANDYQEEPRTRNDVRRDKPSGSKYQEVEGERIPTIEQIRHSSQTHKFNQRKQSRLGDSSPEKRGRESGGVKKKRRSEYRDRGGMTSAEGVDRKAFSYSDYAIDTTQNDSYRYQQKMAGYDRYLDGRTRKDSTDDQEQMKASSDDYHKTLSEFRQRQQKKPQNLSHDQHHTKGSPRKSRQRREPSDEGEIVSESSSDSRVS